MVVFGHAQVLEWSKELESFFKYIKFYFDIYKFFTFFQEYKENSLCGGALVADDFVMTCE